MPEPGSDLDAILGASEARPSVEGQDFDDFVRSVWPSLVRTARLMGATEQAAEDHAQSALVKAFLAWRKVQRADDPVAYVHRIVINTRIDAVRRRSSSEVPVEQLVGEEGGPDATAGVVTRTDIAAALRDLPVHQRRVVVLRFFVGMSEADTASALRVPVGTVKSRTARALQALAANPRVADLISRRSR